MNKQATITTNIYEKNKVIPNGIEMERHKSITTPKGLVISTMSIICKLGVNININSINTNMKLSHDDIILIKLNNSIRAIDNALIKKKKKTKHEKKSFYNQITTIINVNNINKVNVKLFINGSIQMTGCKSIDDSYIVLDKLIKRLKEEDFVSDNKIIKISDYKITLINSDYKIKFNINRDILYKLLKEENIDSSFKPNIHAGVIIKYPITELDIINKTSTLIFESGKIIITGAKNEYQIKTTYNYINSFLRKYKSEIIKKNIDYTLFL